MTTRRVHTFYLTLLTLSLLSHFVTLPNFLGPQLRTPASVIDPKLLGQLEDVHVGENRDLHFYAKIDTGAESSSIHAQNISTFHQTVDGKKVLFVKFQTIDENYQLHTFTRPVVRVGQVKSALGYSKRYFIREKIWIGNAFHYVNVNLADRSHLKRKFLVGKNILNEGYLINTSLNVP